MYNKTKRGVLLAAGIVGIVLGALIFNLYIYLLAIISIIDTEYRPSSGIIVLMVFTMLFGAAMIVFGSFMCLKPHKRQIGIYNYRRWATISNIVFSGLILTSMIIYMSILSFSGIHLIDIFISVGILALCVVGLCLKDKSTEVYNIQENKDSAELSQSANEYQVSNNKVADNSANVLVSKIVELKHLYNLKVINVEQYQVALTKNIGEFISQETEN